MLLRLLFTVLLLPAVPANAQDAQREEAAYLQAAFQMSADVAALGQVAVIKGTLNRTKNFGQSLMLEAGETAAAAEVLALAQGLLLSGGALPDYEYAFYRELSAGPRFDRILLLQIMASSLDELGMAEDVLSAGSALTPYAATRAALLERRIATLQTMLRQ